MSQGVAEPGQVDAEVAEEHDCHAVLDREQPQKQMTAAYGPPCGLRLSYRRLHCSAQPGRNWERRGQPGAAPDLFG